jgi:hypothetical protein
MGLVLWFLFCLLSFLSSFVFTVFQVVTHLQAHDPYGAAAWGVGGIAVIWFTRALMVAAALSVQEEMKAGRL